ncbi:hypothetical protein ACLB2K_072573 [Fragaria x ananassa]
MFQSPTTAKSLTWHGDRKKDGMMRHPADSPTWKLVDTQWPEFGKEPRNLRLALSSDGFNPYAALSSKYSCWAVILVTYSLPPWLCMKRKFMMLSLLISGPKQPGKDIDVYLQPLIDDLKLLCSIKMYTGLLRKQPGKKKASPWKPLLGAPIQKDDVSCGYYVMRYMKEIVEDNNIDLDKKWGTRAGLTYTAEDIDEIRGEWAEHVLQFPDQ